MDGAGYTLYTANLATGRIKKYSIVLSSITFFVFPVSWIAYYFGGSVEITYYIAIITNLIFHVVRMFLTQENVGLKVSRFVKTVYIPILITTVFSIIPSIIICYLIPASFIRFLISLVVGVCMSGGMALLFGMDKHERSVILKKAETMISNIIRRSRG